MNADQNDLIEQLYLEMHDLLIAYARCALQEESLAEEAVQETFQIACQKPEELFDSLNPKGWLVNTLKNTIRNMKRSRESSRQLLARYLAEQSKNITFSEDNVHFEIMYGNVANTEEFKLIREMAVDGKSHLEMATARGITVAACKKRVQRAKEILQKKLKIYVTK
jgi:RNA polymerase sigma-70 factor (ECF subfamily)